MAKKKKRKCSKCGETIEAFNASIRIAGEDVGCVDCWKPPKK